MKSILLPLIIFYIITFKGNAQHTRPANQQITIAYQSALTQAQLSSQGHILVNVHPHDLQQWKQTGYVQYSQLGAKGDGKSDDILPIAAAHAIANANKLAVKADANASYYIGPSARIAYIQTDTDFGNAQFIIDDTNVEHRTTPIFSVVSDHTPVPLKGINSLKRNQARIKAQLPGPSIITVTNKNLRHYIRFGLNQDNGSAQTDLFVVDAKGKVDQNAPIIWDFKEITEIIALPIDQKPLTIKGGKFTTIANQAESKYNYYARNIDIRRSHVTIDSLQHFIIGEGDHGAPYSGFLSISNCAYVTVKNTVLTGHKTYQTIGAAGKPVSMGSYDLSINRALNISIINSSQTNDIRDRTYWGILGSNYCKNLLYDNCTFSRFDAHKGVANATIRNSRLGHMGINAIGSGKLIVENTTIYGRSLVNLRSDYGSTWQGEFIIRNCTLVPPAESQITAISLISGSYNGEHDFGYQCHMPKKIKIENLQIKDGNHGDKYTGAVLFANFNPAFKDQSFQEKYPYIKTQKVVLKNINSDSNKSVRISHNNYMFKDTKLKK